MNDKDENIKYIVDMNMDLVIDDNSTDNTLRILKNFKNTNPQIHVLSNPINKGALFNIVNSINN